MTRFHVAYICDDNYAMPTQVSMVSLRENANGNYFVVHIITTGLSEQNKSILLSVANEHMIVQMHEVSIHDYRDTISGISQRTHVTTTALLKFELQNIITEDVVLYLDSDIIVVRDIQSIFETNIEEKYAACAWELWKLLQEKEKTSQPCFYFNSGVMLLNLKYMRDKESDKRLWEEKIKLSKDNRSKTMDQDAFNMVFKNNVAILSSIYNFNPYFADKKYIRLLNEYGNMNIISISDVLKVVNVIHYVGKEDKPWIYSTARMGEYWEKSYIDSGLKLDKLERKKIERGLGYYFQILKKLFREHGVKYALRKVWKRLGR